MAMATSIANIIASVGVVDSLLYIAREFRRSSRNASLERFAKAIETQVHQFAHLADEPEKAELVRQGLADLEQLDRGQQGQFSAIIHDILLAHDLVRRAFESGELPEREFRIMQDLWVSIMRTRGGSQWWAGWRGIMPDEVVDYVDAALDVLRRARDKGFEGVRLVQAPFNNISLALYSKLGFDVQEPLSVMQGPALNSSVSGHDVRAATSDDLDECDALCRKTHGHDRHGHLVDAIQQGTATIVERDGRITGYASMIGFFGHSVGETNDDLKALIGNAEEFVGPGFHVPSRNAELMRWCLEQGLRIRQPMTLMSIGPYQKPTGAFIPSIIF